MTLETQEKIAVDPDGFFIDDLQDRPVPGIHKTFFDALPKGAWLQLGNVDSDDIIQTCVDQWTNIGLVSALLLTIQFAVIYALHDFDWTAIAEHWGSETLVKGSFDAILCMMVISVLITLFGLIFVLVQLLGIGELSGASELRTVLEICGASADSGFLCVVIGIGTLGIVTWFYGLLIMKSWWGLVIYNVICLGMTYVQISLQTVKFVRALFQVKNLSKTKRHSPICLSLGQVKKEVDSYISKIGSVELLTVCAFKQYYLRKIRRNDPLLYLIFGEATERRIAMYVDELMTETLAREKDALGSSYCVPSGEIRPVLEVLPAKK